MRLFLVRHGESVDNVAGLFAGSRDSPLTNHGVLQARRLGAHLCSRSRTIGPVKQIFSSNLRRAVKTAEATVEAQSRADGVGGAREVVQLPELREKDFGSDEGKRFGTRGLEGTNASKAAGYVEPESQEAMRVRVERFIDVHLVPAILRDADGDVPHSIVVVAHGVILNVLLRCLLTRLGPEELSRLSRPGDVSGRTGWLAAWSNAGYLEAELRITKAVRASTAEASTSTGQTSPIAPTSALSDPATCVPSSFSRGQSPSETPVRIQMSVKTVNCVEHLQGLKKTRGGIGSLGFDEKQKTMDSFFSRPAKKPKLAKDGGGDD